MLVSSVARIDQPRWTFKPTGFTSHLFGLEHVIVRGGACNGILRALTSRNCIMDRKLTITLLGDVHLSLRGQTIPKFRSRKALALFIYLLSTRKSHSREEVADLLWDATSTRQSLSNLRTVLSMLRPVLGSFLCKDQNKLCISHVQEMQVDYWTLQAALNTVPQQLDAHSAQKLHGALHLYGGDFLANFHVNGAPRFYAWVRNERQSLRDRVVTAYHHLTDYQIQSQQYRAGIRTADEWLEIDPTNEAAHGLLMSLLVKTGRRQAAVAQYQRCRAILRQELGVEPDSQIEQLYQKILDRTVGIEAGFSLRK